MVAGVELYSHIKKDQVQTYHALGKFSRRQTADSFINCPRKLGLTLRANCHQRGQLARSVKHKFARSVKSYFLGKIRTLFQNVYC